MSCDLFLFAGVLSNKRSSRFATTGMGTPVKVT